MNLNEIKNIIEKSKNLFSFFKFDTRTDGILSLPKQSNFCVKHSGAITLTDATYTDLIYTTEEYDIQSEYNTTTGIFTAKENGIYLFIGSAFIDSTSYQDGDAILLLLRDSSNTDLGVLNRKDWGATDNTIYKQIRGSRSLQLSKGDTVKLVFYNSTGGNLSLYTSNNLYNYFSGIKIA